MQKMETKAKMMQFQWYEPKLQQKTKSRCNNELRNEIAKISIQKFNKTYKLSTRCFGKLGKLGSKFMLCHEQNLHNNVGILIQVVRHFLFVSIGGLRSDDSPQFRQKDNISLLYMLRVQDQNTKGLEDFELRFELSLVQNS
eukprot:TRINITY_DN6413_c0_g4_i1.p4 TRINITY_DN6413_c0_g4~~TRINITY_DN6413_c0_g4_i1.p4  ORF type:complete len:141 (-),score=2.09 TRINITY_DN6413_c0_g4_i1:323-745(-)